MTGRNPEARTRSLQMLLERTIIEGQVELAALSDIDECVLGEDRWIMPGPSTWPRWLTVPADIRKAAYEATLADLVQRRMVLGWKTAPGRRWLIPSAELAIIVQSRTAPGFVITFLEGEPGSLPIVPFAYAFLDDDGLQGYVVEIRSPDRHDYQLVTPARCVRGLARYAFNSVSGRLPGVASGPLTLAVVSGSSWAGAQLRKVRIEEARTVGLRVTDLGTGSVEECFTDEEAAVVLDEIFGQILRISSAARLAHKETELYDLGEHG